MTTMPIPEGKILCHCGCGELTDKYDKKGRERFYVYGHQSVGRKASEETKLKLSQSHKGKKLSEESRLKLSQSNKGRKHTEESRLKIGRANSGRKPSAEAIKKAIEAHKGKKLSEESRLKISKSHEGRKHTEESKLKMSRVQKGKKMSKESMLKAAQTRKTRREAKLLPFELAKEAARKIAKEKGIKSQHQWQTYWKSEKPKHLPRRPEITYKDKFKGYPDWLGVEGNLSFQELKSRVRFDGVKNRRGFREWRKRQPDRDRIKSAPYASYKKEWKGWPDFFGYENTDWTVEKVKALLRDWFESGTIAEEDDVVLLSMISANGLLKLAGNSKHNLFFKNLVEAKNTPEGLKAIEEYAYSGKDVQEPPELGGSDVNEYEELGTATEQEIAELVKNETNPLDYGKVEPLDKLRRSTQRLDLDSYTADIEKMQFFVQVKIRGWRSRAFVDEQHEKETVAEAIVSRNGKPYNDEVINTFLREYYGARSIQVPKGYAFKTRDEKTGEMKLTWPKLMQLFVAYKVKTDHRFANLSGTGAGKTLSAVLTSRVIDSKLTVIICPNSVIKQWKDHIEAIYPDSIGNVIIGKEAFNEIYEQDKHKYLVINYDLLSQRSSEDWIQKLGQQQIDFFILDETHFVKIRHRVIESKRRSNLEKLLSYPKTKNAYVLGMSATPVINNLHEGKSFLELVTGKRYDDISIKQTIHNAIKLYEKLSLISLREIPQYTPPTIDPVEVDVDFTKQTKFKVSQLKSFLAFEQLVVDAKIPEIIERINGQPTIIYTQFVEDIIPRITKAVRDAGYTTAEYTGRDHSGIDRFKHKEVDVLVASEPASTGVDGLQNVCHNLIISGLPWTNARYQQLVGRLVRINQENDVTVHIIKATINKREYDEMKWKRILDKKTIADCAVDGILPFKNLASPAQAVQEQRKWLERLERGEISTIEREDLRAVVIPPIQTASAAGVVKKPSSYEYNDFSLMTREMNTERSETTHQRFIDHPEQWHEYHRLRAIAEQEDLDIPRDIIKSELEKRSKNLVIADFGCGEAQLAKELGTDRVRYSFDHLAKEEDKEIVRQCDMKDSGLPNESIDVAVFSLSMKGKNWCDYISEAYRCLYHHAIIIIADTTNSINKEEGRLYALRDELKTHNFEIYSDRQIGKFTFIEARKL